MIDPDNDGDDDTSPVSSERPPAPMGRHLSVSHGGAVTSHATPEAAAKAQDAHHRAGVARHHKAVSAAMNGGGKRR